MSDVESLHHRIEQAELRLKTAHTARQRESAALTAMWTQIKDRFALQSAEIVRLRQEIAELQDMREQLSGMVGTLLGSIEASIDRMADETVPRITGLAEDLLNAEAADMGSFPALDSLGAVPARPRAPEPPPAPAPAAEDFLSVLTEQLEDVDVPAPPPLPGHAVARVTSAPVSPGIRDLISRVEGAFETRESDAEDPLPEEEPQEGDQELARDLSDIRRLRDELQNLRARIGAAH